MRSTKMATLLASVLTLVGVLVFAPTSSSQAVTVNPPGSGWPYGCRSGWVCLYTGPLGSQPAGPHTDYFYYGAHNLSNVLNGHWLVNNQTGGAKVYPCYNYGGTNCTYVFTYPDGTKLNYLKAGWYVWIDWTPINSIRLTA